MLCMQSSAVYTEAFSAASLVVAQTAVQQNRGSQQIKIFYNRFLTDIEHKNSPMSANRVTKRTQDGNAARQSSRYTSVDIVPASVTVDDTEYHTQVEKLQALHGTRGSYLLGSGALDKNDALFMMEEEEKRSRTMALRASEERRAFTEQLARLRREECDDRGIHNDEERLVEEKHAKGKVLKRGVVQELKERKRKGLVVDKGITEDKHEGKEINVARDEQLKDDGNRADDVNALQLLGCYSEDDSDNKQDSDGPEEPTKRKPLPSALDLL